jgi:hypothetical protein
MSSRRDWMVALVASGALLAGCSGTQDTDVIPIVGTPPASSPGSASSTSPGAPSPSRTQVTEPTADWANADLPVACRGAGTVTFRDGEAVTEVEGISLYSFVGEPVSARILDGVYVIVPTFCSAGSQSLGLATLFRVSEDSTRWEFVRMMGAPAEGSPYAFDRLGFEDGMVYIDWLGYSDTSQPDYRPDISVHTVFPLDPDEPGWVAGTDRVRAVLKDPKLISVAPTYTVPDLLGLDRRQVWQVTALQPFTVFGFPPAGLTANETIFNLNNCLVTSQAPPPGSKVKRGAQIRVTYC